MGSDLEECKRKGGYWLTHSIHDQEWVPCRNCTSPLRCKADDELRQSYLYLANSDDAWFSGKAAKAEAIKQELDRRGVSIFPKEDE